MRTGRWMLLAVTVVLLCSVAVTSVGAARRPKKIAFFDFKTGMKLQKKYTKPTMIHFTMGGCGWCTKLEKEVYVVPEVIKMSRNFVCIKVKRERLPEACQYYKVRGYPTIVFTDTKRKEAHRMVGFVPAERFLTQMKHALSKVKATGDDDEKTDDAKKDKK